MGWFGGAAFGVLYADRTKDKTSPESALGTIGGGAYQIADEFLLNPTDLDYADAGEALAIDVNGVLGEYFNPIVYGDPTQPGFAYLAGKFWDVEEEAWTGYLRGDLNHELGNGVEMRGNIGVQVIATDQSSSSFFIANGGQVATQTDGKSYTDVLPQVNFAFLLENDQTVRIALAKEMARPRMDQLKATEESGYNFGTGESAARAATRAWIPGAPTPSTSRTRSTLPSAAAIVSARRFYKDLRSYIYTETDRTTTFRTCST